MASAEVVVKCETVAGHGWLEPDSVTLKIESNEPIVIFVARYRTQDQVVHLPSGGVFKESTLGSVVPSIYGKYVIKGSTEQLNIVPYSCSRNQK